MTVLECAKLLGETLAKESLLINYNAAKKAYQNDRNLQNALFEYQTQQSILAKEIEKSPEEQDAGLLQAVRTRMDHLYNQIVTSKEYLAVNELQERVNELMEAVNSEVNFYAFGERPCTHNCSTCHAECSSRPASKEE